MNAYHTLLDGTSIATDTIRLPIISPSIYNYERMLFEAASGHHDYLRDFSQSILDSENSTINSFKTEIFTQNLIFVKNRIISDHETICKLKLQSFNEQNVHYKIHGILNKGSSFVDNLITKLTKRKYRNLILIENRIVKDGLIMHLIKWKDIDTYYQQILREKFNLINDETINFIFLEIREDNEQKLKS